MNTEVVSFGLILRRKEEERTILEVRVPGDAEDPWRWIDITIKHSIKFDSSALQSGLIFMNEPDADARIVSSFLSNLKRIVEGKPAREYTKWEATEFPAQDKGKFLFAGLHMRRVSI